MRTFVANRRKAGKAAKLLLNKYMYIYQALSLYCTTDRVRPTNCCECKRYIPYDIRLSFRLSNFGIICIE